MRERKKILPVLFAGTALAGICLLAGCGRQTAEAQEVNTEKTVSVVETGLDLSTISEGIYIGDVSVGGMTSSQAASAIRSYVEDIAEQPVVLAANDEAVTTTVTELGFTEDIGSTIEDAVNYGKTGNILKRYKEQKDLEEEKKVLPLALKADEEKVEAYLEEHVGELNLQAIDYGLTLEGDTFVIEEGQIGQQVNVEESVDLIMNSFASGWQENSTINLVVEETEPRGSAEELSLVQDILGKFSTDYSSSSDARKTNIMTGANYIDGTVVYPGEMFSVEEAVTPFDEEHGYAEAPSYENGATVETYGGGICQVSTTLYNALIRAELEIDERHGHSMIVSYVDPSADAAIAEGTKDLKFTNDTDAPVYISAYADGATLSFTVYGHETRPSNRSVSFESETTETTEPTVEYRACDDPLGYITEAQSAHAGSEAELWKVVTVDGVEESREIFNTTTYQMSPTIYEVGISSSSSAAVSAMYDAIASQNIDRIYATISAYAGSGSSSSYSEETYTETDYEPQEDSNYEETTDAVDSGSTEGTEDTQDYDPGGGGGEAAD